MERALLHEGGVRQAGEGGGGGEVDSWAVCPPRPRLPSVPHVVHHALHEAHRPRGRARGAAKSAAPAYVLLSVLCAARAGPTRLGAVIRCCLRAIALGAVLLD